MSEKLQISAKSPEYNKKVFDNAYQRVQHVLRNFYGVENLSLLEASRLKQIIKEVMGEEADYDKAMDQGEVEGTQTFYYLSEVPARWLYELYGIKPEDIPSDYVIQGEKFPSGL